VGEKAKEQTIGQGNEPLFSKTRRTQHKEQREKKKKRKKVQ